MVVLITGGGGYIGGTVAALLASRGHQPVIFDNLSHSRRDLVPEGIEFIHGELADRALLEDLFKAAKSRGAPFDAVMHFAALIEAGESMVRPETFFRNNTASTLVAAWRPCWPHGPRRLVFSSTAAVYGEPERVPILEDARLQPTNAYGESKLLVEHMLRWFNQIHGLRYASLRYFNVAGAPEGPDGITRGEAHDPESHLIPLVLDVALGRRSAIRMLRRRLPHPGRHLHPRLHPRLRPRRCPSAGAGEARDREPPDLQPRQRARLQRARGHRIRPPRHRPPHSGGSPPPPPRRSGCLGGQFGKGHPRAGLEAPVYEAGRHRTHGVGLAPEAV